MYFAVSTEDYEEPAFCDIVAGYSSPYVKAFTESRIETESCETYQTDDKDWQIHVVHVTGGKERSRQRQPIQLYISSQNKYGKIFLYLKFWFLVY